jgi:hypothetical protein
MITLLLMAIPGILVYIEGEIRIRALKADVRLLQEIDDQLQNFLKEHQHDN